MDLGEFIPDYYQETIENYMKKVPLWSFDDNVSGMPDMDIELPDGLSFANSQYGFGSPIYSPSFGWETEERLFAILQPMIAKALKIFPIELDVHRVRGGLMTRHSFNGLNYPHVDFHNPHYTFLYYVNDSDGDTFIFNEKVDHNATEHTMPKKLTLMNRFKPKRGHAIMFNGLLYHSSSTPVDHDSRIAININLFPINKDEV